MVGVPGRSKGCHTCKKRHVKCDEEKPECARCRKAGYKCAGYERQLEFRIATPSSHGQASSTMSTAASSRAPSPDKVPPEISLVAWKPDMQYAFLFRNFVWASYGSPWLQLSAQGKVGVLAQQACSCFSMVTFGRHHGRNDIELEGAAMYSQAVAKVRSGLAAPPNPFLAELLIPILIFLLHSSMDPSTGESASHVMGLFRLVAMCGPQGFQRRPLRDAFSSCRATLVTVGLLQKRRLFLEDSQWCTVPWALQPEAKSNQDKLVDLLAQMPGLLADQQALRNEFDADGHSRLISSTSNYLRLLFRWRYRWESENQRAVAAVPRNVAFSGSSRPSDTQHLLQFSSFTLAVEIALYNAILLCYLGLLHSELSPAQARTISERLAQAEAVSQTSWFNRALAHPFYSGLSLRSAAVEIVRSFEYQLLHIQQCPDTPALFWLFPLGLASKVLADDVAMTQRIQGMLDTSMVTRGYGRGENVFGFGFYELPKVDERVSDSYSDFDVS